MVEVKRICAAEKSFIGIHLHLPGYPSYMIVTAKTILAQNMFQIQYFEKDADIAVFDGNPMEVFTPTRYTLIDGKIVFSADSEADAQS